MLGQMFRPLIQLYQSDQSRRDWPWKMIKPRREMAYDRHQIGLAVRAA
jgi:hypothetical protein